METYFCFTCLFVICRYCAVEYQMKLCFCFYSSCALLLRWMDQYFFLWLNHGIMMVVQCETREVGGHPPPGLLLLHENHHQLQETVFHSRTVSDFKEFPNIYLSKNNQEVLNLDFLNYIQFKYLIAREKMKNQGAGKKRVMKSKFFCRVYARRGKN